MTSFGVWRKKDINLLIMFDLSAAFDTVSHKVLIDLLEKQFGVSGTALEWFQNYLHDRKIKVCVDGQYSMEKIKLLSASGKTSWPSSL